MMDTKPNSPPSTSHTRPSGGGSSHMSSLHRRRTGLLVAHGNLSRRNLGEGGGGGRPASNSCPVLPTRELSNPSLCVGSFHSRAYEEQDCSIPALDLKIQHLLNLEGREFLHSSLRSPIPPCREPTVIPSGHSRSTIPLEEQVYPTTLPDARRKQETLQGSYLHTSISVPIQPVREPSVARSLGGSSIHSGGATSMTSTIATPYSIPSLTTIPAITYGRRGRVCQSDAEYSSDSEEDDDILSEEETEAETDMDESVHYEDITIDYPLLGPALGSITMGRPTASMVQPTTTTTAASLLPRCSSAASMQSTHTSNSLASNVTEAEELRALKQYWADLGQRIDAMEARGIKNSLTDLGVRLDAINRRSEQRACDKPADLGPAPSEKSKSKSRSSSSAKSAPMPLRTSSRSRRSSECVRSTRSKSVDAGERRQRPRRSSRRSGGNKTSKESHGGGTSSENKERTRTSRRSSTTTATTSSSSKPCKLHQQGEDCTTLMDDSRGSNNRCLYHDGSGSSSSTRRKATSAMADGSGSSQSISLSSSRHSSGSGNRRGGRRSSTTSSSSRKPQSSDVGGEELVSSSKRRSSSRRLADATDSVELAPRTSTRRSSTTTSSSRRVKSSSRSKQVMKDSSGKSTGENDHVRERKSLSRSTGATTTTSSGSRSPGTPKSSSSSRPRRSHRMSNNGRSLSTLTPRGDESLCSMPAVLGNLDDRYVKSEAEDDHDDEEQETRRRQRLPKSPRDTMDVNWWRFHHEQQASNRSLPVGAALGVAANTKSNGRFQSRMGKNLVF